MTKSSSGCNGLNMQNCKWMVMHKILLYNLDLLKCIWAQILAYMLYTEPYRFNLHWYFCEIKWLPVWYLVLFFIHFCVKYMKGLVTLSMSALSLFWGLHSCGLYSLHSLEVTLMVYTPSSRLYLMLRQGNQVRLSLFFCL